MIVSQQWDGAANSYAEGDLVLFKGVVCEAVADIPASSSNQSPIYTYDERTGYSAGDTTNWVVRGVSDSSLSYFALVESIKLATISDDEAINNSVGEAIKDVENSFYTRRRVPVMVEVATLTVDANGRVVPPSDLMEVIHQNIETAGGGQTDGFNSLVRRGQIEIISANSFEWNYLRQTARNDFNYFGSSEQAIARSLTYFKFGRYWEYSPALGEGTEIRLTYYSRVPQLNTVHPIVDANGEPINNDGMTLAQWVAAGNTGTSFVQGTIHIDTNWFSSVKPDMIKFGAIMNLEQYLHDNEQWPVWQQKFVQAEAELSELVERFDDRGPNTSSMYTTYPI